MATDYRYDAFVSYPHSRVIRPWVVDYFYEYFTGFLTEELEGRKARVFMDDRDIYPGTKWPGEIREALRFSKVLVPIWTPSYFESDWCLSEWKSFTGRETLLELEGSPTNLVVPVLFKKGSSFPQEALETQWVDFCDCRSTVPAFLNDPMAIVFERKVEQFATAVARAVKAAPACRPDWPISITKAGRRPAVKLMRL